MTNESTIEYGAMTGWTPSMRNLLPIRPARMPGDPADQRQQDGLEQELGEDRALGRTDRFADADLAGALGDGDEHDVHDADAADEERDRGHGARAGR